MGATEKKILGVDLGTKKVGLAIADWDIRIATGYGVIEYINRKKFIGRIAEIVRNENIGLVVIGLPVNIDGSEGTKAVEARKTGELIRESSQVDIELADESLTTFQAIRELHKGKGKVGKSRDKINMMAAILILQEYLDSLPPTYSGRGK